LKHFQRERFLDVLKTCLSGNGLIERSIFVLATDSGGHGYQIFQQTIKALCMHIYVQHAPSK